MRHHHCQSVNSQSASSPLTMTALDDKATSMPHNNQCSDNGGDIMTLPPTDILYMTYEGNWCLECTATVLACQPGGNRNSSNHKDCNDSWCVLLDRTILHAQGGGQPSDRGQLVGQDSGQVMQVTKVTVDRATGIVQHECSLVKSTAATAAVTTGDRHRHEQDQNNLDTRSSNQHGSFLRGETVLVSVDPDLRGILSECHSAGHVVDSAMARCDKLLKPSKAYHFLEGPYVEYEGSIPVEERDSFLIRLKEAFQQLVEEDIPTMIELMSKEKADLVCNRQAQNFDMDVFADPRTQQIRVVTVAGYPCPCGGTHVRSTGELKTRTWAVTGLKCKKGIVQVKYRCSTSK